MENKPIPSLIAKIHGSEMEKRRIPSWKSKFERYQMENKPIPSLRAKIHGS
jgi:hypothetical protein